MHFVPNLEHISNNSIKTRGDLKSVLGVKSSTVRGVSAIKVSGRVAERFFLPADSGYHRLSRAAARSFGSQKNKRQPHKRLPPFFLTAARTEYGLLIVGANGLESPQL